MPHVNPLFWRAALAFLLMPGIVAGLVPWYLLRPSGRPFHLLGLGPLVVGTILLLWCVRDFYAVGRGTLAPWDPPANVVAVGLYRFSRNPMYVAVLLILAGWAIAYASRTLTVYALGIGLAFHLRVVFWEEPTLARLHGEAWTRYRASVRRWF